MPDFFKDMPRWVLVTWTLLTAVTLTKCVLDEPASPQTTAQIEANANASVSGTLPSGVQYDATTMRNEGNAEVTVLLFRAPAPYKSNSEMVLFLADAQASLAQVYGLDPRALAGYSTHSEALPRGTALVIEGPAAAYYVLPIRASSDNSRFGGWALWQKPR